MQRKHAYIWHGMIFVLGVMLAAQLAAAQWNNVRPANIRRASSVYRPLSGRPERRPPLLLVALSADELHLSEAQKNRLRHALPLPPKSPRQETTPSLIASFQSLQMSEWTLICEVFTPQQLEIFLHRLASMRIFRMLQMKLQTLLFSASLPTIRHITQTGDVSAAIVTGCLLMLFGLFAPQFQPLFGISGKARLRRLCVLRI